MDDDQSLFVGLRRSRRKRVVSDLLVGDCNESNFTWSQCQVLRNRMKNSTYVDAIDFLNLSQQLFEHREVYQSLVDAFPVNFHTGHKLPDKFIPVRFDFRQNLFDFSNANLGYLLILF